MSPSSTISASGGGACSLCNTPNAYTMLNCTSCGARLPWADALSGARTSNPNPNPTAPAPPSRVPQGAAPRGGGASSTPARPSAALPMNAEADLPLIELIWQTFCCLILPFAAIYFYFINRKRSPRQARWLLGCGIVSFGLMSIAPTIVGPKRSQSSQQANALRANAASSQTAPNAITNSSSQTSSVQPNAAVTQLTEKLAQAPMESAYIEGISGALIPVDKAIKEFERVTASSPSVADLSAMLDSSQSLLSIALSQMTALSPTPRFQSGHTDLSAGIKSLQASYFSLQTALSNRDEQGIRDGIPAAASSVRSIGQAQMELGTEMEAFGREMEQAAKHASTP